jgi:hypothetical protein
MRERLNMSEGSLNDYLAKLKKKGVVTRDNQLLRFLDIIPYGSYDFNIKFTINE